MAMMNIIYLKETELPGFRNKLVLSSAGKRIAKGD